MKKLLISTSATCFDMRFAYYKLAACEFVFTSQHWIVLDGSLSAKVGPRPTLIGKQDDKGFIDLGRFGFEDGYHNYLNDLKTLPVDVDGKLCKYGKATHSDSFEWPTVESVLDSPLEVFFRAKGRDAHRLSELLQASEPDYKDYAGRSHIRRRKSLRKESLQDYPSRLVNFFKKFPEMSIRKRLAYLKQSKGPVWKLLEGNLEKYPEYSELRFFITDLIKKYTTNIMGSGACCYNGKDSLEMWFPHFLVRNTKHWATKLRQVRPSDPEKKWKPLAEELDMPKISAVIGYNDMKFANNRHESMIKNVDQEAAYIRPHSVAFNSSRDLRHMLGQINNELNFRTCLEKMPEGAEKPGLSPEQVARLRETEIENRQSQLISEADLNSRKSCLGLEKD